MPKREDEILDKVRENIEKLNQNNLHPINFGS
jgi:hypothetical protein